MTKKICYHVNSIKFHFNFSIIIEFYLESCKVIKQKHLQNKFIPVIIKIKEHQKQGRKSHEKNNEE